MQQTEYTASNIIIISASEKLTSKIMYKINLAHDTKCTEVNDII